jgi:hypothetical protein
MRLANRSDIPTIRETPNLTFTQQIAHVVAKYRDGIGGTMYTFVQVHIDLETTKNAMRELKRTLTESARKSHIPSERVIGFSNVFGLFCPELDAFIMMDLGLYSCQPTGSKSFIV